MYKKILFGVICLLCCFGFVKVVKANNYLTTIFQECEYELSYGNLKGDHGKKGKNIYIGYTQLKTPSGANFEIQARYDRSKEFEHLGDIKNYFGFNVDHQTMSYNSYSTAVAGDAGSCPKYMTIELISDDDHKPLFYNDLSKSAQCNYNPSPSTKCKAYFSLVSTVNNVKIDATEKYWTYTTSADNAAICSDLTFKISVSGGQLVGIGTYGRNSKYKDEKKAWTQPKPLQDLTFDDVYDIATKNKFTRNLYFNPDDGGWGGKTSIGIGSEGVDYCYTSSTLSTAYTCITSSEIRSYLNTIEARVNTAYPNIDQLYKSTTKTYGTSVGAQDYSNITDPVKLEEIIKNINTELENAIVDEDKIDAIEEDLNDITSGEYKAGDGKSACKDAKLLVADVHEKLQANAKSFTSKLQTIKQAARNALSHLTKLKEQGAIDEETYNQIVAEYDDIDKKVTNNIKVLDRVRAGMLEGMEFRFASDPDAWDRQLKTCGVLSQDMRDFIDLILWYIKIAGVVLAVILSFVDYIKAASGSDDKSMANANKKVLMRIIFVALLFLVPAILEFVLGALKISTTAGSLSCLK